MATRSSTARTSTARSTTNRGSATRTSAAGETSSVPSSPYVLPVVHLKVPSAVGDGAFWALAGVALAGVIEPPIAAAAAACFLVARRRGRGVPST